MSARWIPLFRSDLRRLWTGRHVRVALWLLLAMLVLQVGVGVLITRIPPRSAWDWLFYASAALGLNNGWTTALQSRLGLLPNTGTTWHFGAPLWWMMLTGVLSLPLLVVFPAAAALSFASERENRRVEELLLAGFTPWEMLLGKGLAAVAPFLGLGLVLQIMELALVGFSAHRTTPGFPEWQQWAMLLGRHTLELTSLVSLSALLVCISALCRRSGMALAACYGAKLGLRIVDQALVFVLWKPVPLRETVLRAVMVAIQILAVVALGRLALHSLAEPEAAGRSKPRSHPIMEYGAEVE